MNWPQTVTWALVVLGSAVTVRGWFVKEKWDRERTQKQAFDADERIRQQAFDAQVKSVIKLIRDLEKQATEYWLGTAGSDPSTPIKATEIRRLFKELGEELEELNANTVTHLKLFRQACTLSPFEESGRQPITDANSDRLLSINKAASGLVKLVKNARRKA